VQLHQWLGRAIALLGIVQIPLGLTLYGSPKVLFILFAVAAFLLLLIYFVLSFRNRREVFFNDDGTTYFSGTYDSYTDGGRSHRHGGKLGALAAGGIAGAGLAALGRRRRQDEVISSRHSSESPSRRHSASYLDEKIDESPQKHTWRNRLLGAGAAIGAVAAAKRLFGRGHKGSDAEVGTYSHPLGGAHSVSRTDISAVEEGRPPESPEDGRHRPLAAGAIPAAAAAAVMATPSRSHRRRSRRSGESINSSSLMSEERTPKKTHTARNTIAALGVIGYMRHRWNERRDHKDDVRVEEARIRDEIEQERINRANSKRKRFTGDGLPPRRTHSGRTGLTSTVGDDVFGSNPELSLTHPNRPGTATVESTSQIPPHSTVQSLATAASTGIPGPSVTAAVPPPPSNLIPPPPPLHDPFLVDSSGSEAYFSAGGRQHRRHHGIGTTAGAAALGAATATAAAAAAQRPQDDRRGSNTDSVTSPPVSVKVKMHKDGRHVTLRRLNEAEAAAEREARRADRRRRNGSVSSVSDVPGTGRYRRGNIASAAPPTDSSQISGLGATSGPIPMPEPPPMAEGYPQIPTGVPPNFPGPPPPPIATQPYNPSPISTVSGLPPPPPPIPGATSAMSGGVASLGTGPYDTGTESNYDNNRRRRRAERAQAKLAQQQGRSGSKVEFT